VRVVAKAAGMQGMVGSMAENPESMARDRKSNPNRLGRAPRSATPPKLETFDDEFCVASGSAGTSITNRKTAPPLARYAETQSTWSSVMIALYARPRQLRK
jgi:hypothetical protein